ncbi:MAG TPA: sensor histidine kinase [Opitutaceae bacterium]|nr:sensor histidine kinase [Opitutaceae bacterium]
MKRIYRVVGVALALLLLCLAAVGFTAAWLKRQNDRLLHHTISTSSVQFAAMLELAQAGPPPWPEEFTRKLGQAMGAQIVVSEQPPASPATTTPWSFDHALRDETGVIVGHARVRLSPPPTMRVLAMLQRMSAILLSISFLVLLLLLLLVLVDRRWLRTDDDTARSAPRETGDFGVLSHLAERSARQSAELAREREDRLRAEADTHLKQLLLNRALQEKIDMGRDLHDGLIQSLYATGLTIQAGRKALDQDPAAARTQIDTALQTLNATIREVRTYISGLGPEQLRQRSFADSVRTVIEHLSAVREIATDVRIDEEAAQQLSSSQFTDALQIIREAVSNSLRHGHAKRITVRLHRNGAELCLAIQDDGRGFDPQQVLRGHGLDNMQARADRLGARLACDSGPERGTRLLLTFSIPISPARP